MLASDPLTQGYANLLDGSYDVVDRIVLNAHFTLGQSPGGFRTWWRNLHDGADDTLDDTHLMRLAGRFSRRLHAWAKDRGVPVVHCGSDERKCDLAAKYLPTDAAFRGIFVVFVSRAPAPIWESIPGKTCGFHLQRKRAWVNHYSFHVLDDEWGHLTIKMCGHAPFSAQVILNGHEYVACRARAMGIPFTKEGNCFTSLSDARDLAECADALRSPTAVGRLSQIIERWIYSCAAFGLSIEEQQATRFRYAYSVYQLEYSRNLLFRRGAQMDEVFQSLIDRTRALLDIRKVKTIFGTRHRPHVGAKAPRFGTVVEKPVFDLTVFKVHFGRRTLKIYSKGERVLRIEAIVHNTAELRCGRILERFPHLVDALGGMLERFLLTVRAVEAPFIRTSTLDDLPLPGHVGTTRVGGVDFNKPRIRELASAIIALSASPEPFTSAQLAKRIRETTKSDYTERQAAYDLRKFRAKSLIARTPKRVGYQATPTGLRTMAALHVLRDKVLLPVLAGVLRPKVGRPPKNRAPIDERYHEIQQHMEGLLLSLGVVAA